MQAKRGGTWLLFPPLPVTLLATIGGLSLLAWSFAGNGLPDALRNLSYALSFWALVIWIARIVRSNPATGVFEAARGNKHLARIINDRHHRLGLTTTLSFGIDVLWTASNAIAAIAQASAWFTTLAVYYALLAIMRAPLSFSILRHSSGEKTRQHLRRELRICRACGVVLLISTPVFAGFTILALHRESNFSYSNYLIYGVALYAFYSLIGSLVKLVRERRSPHPAVRAANALGLVVAGVSMLSLEVAMIDMFSTTSGERFRSTMIIATGAAVCLLAITTGIWMVRSARTDRDATAEPR